MPLLAGAPGAAAAVDEHLRVLRQVGVDHEAEIGQVEAARGDVGRDADARAAVAQRLQRLVALALAELARQRRDREAALGEVRGEVRDAVAGRAEHQRARRVVEAQQVDDREVALARHDRDRVVLDVAVALGLARRSRCAARRFW